MDSEKLAIVRSYWSAEGERRLDRILSHFSEDAELVSGSRAYRGRERIGEFYERVIAMNDKIVVTPTNSIEQGAEIAVEFTCSMVEKTGETRTAVGCNVFLVENGMIQRLRSYFVPLES